MAEAVGSVLLDLFIIFIAAKLAGELFDRLGQPAVVGELLAGVLIGPYALGLIGKPSAALEQLFGNHAAADSALQLTYNVLAELGVIILLFFVGLETPVNDIMKVGKRASIVAVAGIVVPFVSGMGLFLALGEAPVEALFVGAALVATSVGITARVLSDLGRLSTQAARIILGAAVIDDILGLLVLTVVTSIGRGGSVNPLGVGLTAFQALLFVVVVVIVGGQLLSRFGYRLEGLRIRQGPFVAGMAACLGLAALANSIGLAAIIGAFLAGMVFAETKEEFELERQGLPLYEFLVPFFFVITGSEVDWRLFADPQTFGISMLVTGVAVLTKLVACGLASAGLGWRKMAIIGTGMVPRGEVGLIVAGAGASLGIFQPRLFSVIVIMSVLTTLIVPPVLALIYRYDPEKPGPPDELEILPGM